MSATPNRSAVAVILLVPLMAALALWAFSWPAARMTPRDVPVAVAGAAPAADRIQQQLEQREGAFEVHRYDDAAAASAAIEDRAVYGAVVITSQGPQLLTASAASPAVAQLLRDAAAGAVPGGAGLPVTDVVAVPGTDPRGSAFGASFLPLALAGVASGAVATLVGLRGARAAVTLIGAAVLAGIAATAVAHSWLGVLTGDWWTEAGAIGLTVLAIGAAVAGLAALLGVRGIGLGALLMVLLGNPFSGITSAPELLPVPLGMIGQWLPPGAGGTLLRSVAYFDGSATGAAVLTLSLWTVLGLAAVLLGTRRRPQPAAGTPGERETCPAG